MREIIKTVLLAFLIASALFQTQELWFRNISRGFFDILPLQAAQNNISYSEYFVAPTRMLTSLGNNRFVLQYNPGSISHLGYIFAYALDSEPVITNVTPELFSGRSIIYHYNFDMPAWAFFEHFGIENRLPLEYFNKIIIVPQMVTNLVHISFVGDRVVNYTITTSANVALNSHIQNAHRDYGAAPFYYASSSIMGFDFESNIFLPRWRGEAFEYNPIAISSMFNDDLIEMGQKINFFFDNPAMVRSDNRNGVFTYGDFNVVVNYYNGVLEYTNHRQGFSQGNLLTDFDRAMAFLTNDTNVVNYFFLQGFTTGDTYTIFYFDYIINNFPVMLAGAPQDHWLQIKVNQGYVTNYSKIAFALYQTQNTSYQQKDIISLVDSVGLNIYPVFGYVYNFRSAFAHIDWVIEGTE